MELGHACSWFNFKSHSISAFQAFFGHPAMLPVPKVGQQPYSPGLEQAVWL